MREEPGQDDVVRASVFLRITEVQRGKGDRAAESLIEIEADGTIPREIDLTEDGTPIRITRPGEYGEWNDSPYPPTPTSSRMFEEEWGSVGAEMPREEFEAIYARADAMLPHPETIGWLPCLLGLLITIVVVASVIGFIVGLVDDLV